MPATDSVLVYGRDATGKTTAVGISPGTQATGTLTSNNTIASAGDTVTIGSVTYTFKTTLTPAEGEVLAVTDADTTLLNLIRAINGSGTNGTDYYSRNPNGHPDVTAATSVTAHAFVVTAREAGAAGNSIATTETDGSTARLGWGATTLLGGTNAGLIAAPQNKFLNITTGTTTTVKTGAGVLHSIVVGTTAAGAITIYDNTAASGTKIGILKSSIVEGTYIYDVAFNTGLTIVTAAASDICVTYR